MFLFFFKLGKMKWLSKNLGGQNPKIPNTQLGGPKQVVRPTKEVYTHVQTGTATKGAIS